MYDKNAEFDLTAVGPRYPALRAAETGSWRMVLEDGRPIGVVWLMPDEPAGAGVTWLRQTESVEKLRRHFVQAVQAGTSAVMAYNATELLDGVKLTPEQRGPLSAVDEEMTALMQDM